MFGNLYSGLKNFSFFAFSFFNFPGVQKKYKTQEGAIFGRFVRPTPIFILATHCEYTFGVS